MNIYQLSGLGAGEEVYAKINLKNPVVFLPWIKNKKNESLEEYAARISQEIDTTKPFCLMGVSFGGIVCLEIAKILKPEKVILISSAKTSNEIPFYVKFSAFIGLFKLIPESTIRNTKGLTHFLFGAKRSGEKKFLNDILDSINVSYLKWCLAKIGTWKNKEIPKNLIHIHGENDFLFPKRFTKGVDYWLEGGHFICVRRGNEISKIVEQELKNY